MDLCSHFFFAIKCSCHKRWRFHSLCVWNHYLTLKHSMLSTKNICNTHVTDTKSQLELGQNWYKLRSHNQLLSHQIPDTSNHHTILKIDINVYLWIQKYGKTNTSTDKDQHLNFTVQRRERSKEHMNLGSGTKLMTNVIVWLHINSCSHPSYFQLCS